MLGWVIVYAAMLVSILVLIFTIYLQRTLIRDLRRSIISGSDQYHALREQHLALREARGSDDIAGGP